MSQLTSGIEEVCAYYLNIADYVLSQPEGVVPNEVSDRDLFSLLSNFYLNQHQRTDTKICSNDETTSDLILV